MSEFFDNVDSNNKQYIPPDYSDEADSIYPSENEEDDEDFDYLDIEDDDDEEVEERIEELLDQQNKNNERLMQSTPFGNPSPSPSWGNQGGSSWGPGGGSSPSSPWGGGSPSPGGNVWGRGNSGGSIWGTGNNNQSTVGKEQLDRTKKVIFIDFLDAIVETYQSNGQPGLIPRDIYDLKPRFDVWQKLAAFNPEKVYAMIPRNLLTNSTGLAGGLETMMNYFCCSLAAFLRLPYESCQILVQGNIGQRKEEIIRSVMKGSDYKIQENDTVLIGINSGLYGQSNSDLIAANTCGITYYDLNQLLNNLY